MTKMKSRDIHPDIVYHRLQEIQSIPSFLLWVRSHVCTGKWLTWIATGSFLEDCMPRFLGTDCSAHVYATCCVSGTGFHEGQIFKGPWTSHKCYTKAAFPKKLNINKNSHFEKLDCLEGIILLPKIKWNKNLLPGSVCTRWENSGQGIVIDNCDSLGCSFKV